MPGQLCRRPVIGLFGLAMLAIVAAGCAEEEPTDFTADNRSGFMAACSVPVDDSLLISDICQCAFDKTQAEIPFDRFTAIDEELKATPGRLLSTEITEIIADCIIEEADL